MLPRLHIFMLVLTYSDQVFLGLSQWDQIISFSWDILEKWGKVSKANPHPFIHMNPLSRNPGSTPVCCWADLFQSHFVGNPEGSFRRVRLSRLKTPITIITYTSMALSNSPLLAYTRPVLSRPLETASNISLKIQDNNITTCKMAEYLSQYIRFSFSFLFCFCLIWFFTSHQQSFSYKETALPGLNQY